MLQVWDRRWRRSMTRFLSWKAWWWCRVFPEYATNSTTGWWAEPHVYESSNEPTYTACHPYQESAIISIDVLATLYLLSCLLSSGTAAVYCIDSVWFSCSPYSKIRKNVYVLPLSALSQKRFLENFILVLPNQTILFPDVTLREIMAFLHEFDAFEVDDIEPQEKHIRVNIPQ